MTTIDEFGAYLRDFLPRHQREHGFQEIDEATTVHAHKFAAKAAMAGNGQRNVSGDGSVRAQSQYDEFTRRCAGAVQLD